MTVTRYYIAPDGHDNECLWKDTESREAVLVMESYKVDPDVWEALSRWVDQMNSGLNDLDELTKLLIEPVRSAHDKGCAIRRSRMAYEPPIELRWCDCWRRDLARNMARRVLQSPWATSRMPGLSV